MIKIVFFDVGETLIDETRHWQEWADYLGVPPFTFFTALGRLLEQGRSHRDVFTLFDAEFDYDAAWAKRQAQGERYKFQQTDFYRDVFPCLATLQKRGYRVGIAGNQPKGCVDALHDANMSADIIASSSAWGVEKPSQAFFEKIIDVSSVRADQIAYVGDRLDNDILPARRAGMKAILLHRGPWGVFDTAKLEAAQASAVIKSLTDLPDRLDEMSSL
ncbi:MAG: HAD family hydrolase [Pseudomonadota bacterium]